MKSNFDCVIVGCGIAGMTAAIYLKRANVNFCIIDFDAPGGTLNKVKTISNYPGFKEISGPELAFRVFEQISSLDILIKYGKVLKIEDNIITTDKEEIKAKKIIIATGRPPKHIKLLEDLDNVSYCALCDGSLYKNKNVALIGKSETAYNEAIYLSSLCNKVTIISEDEINFAPLKNYNNIVLKEKNNLKLIEKEKNLVKKIITDKEVIDVDAVFVYNGYEPKTDFVKGINLKNGYIVVNKNMQSSNKDIYACGDIILKDIYQITTAVSEATIAAINVKKELS
ncbi:thioredoxin reductase [Acholeplasma sp. CAG:878]|nr:thioredoxin reductase [Acholeplasma sp. CAG:878]